MKRAIFLDRDGVLNRSFMVNGVPKPPTSVEDVEILVGVVEAIHSLKKHGFLPIVVTNQPDVARGSLTRESVEGINNFLSRSLGINYFFTCFHDSRDSCECRKPKPGLLLSAAQELGINLQESVMVGDRWRDMEAGQTVGCECFFIDYGYLEKSPLMPYRRVSSLLEVARFYIGES